jgi:phosphate transport system protein
MAEIRSRFHQSLDEMEADLAHMGRLSEAMVRDAVRALVDRDDELAQRVIAADDDVDELYLKVDHGSLDVLALQAPVAADLRLVSVLLHCSLHVERIGDQAVNIAKMHLATKDLPSSQPILQRIAEMGDLVVAMVETAIEAFRRRDLALCLRLPTLDDPVDRLNRTLYLEILKLADDLRALDWGMHANLAARALERVGDNAVDIGEQVAFLITGEFREFTDASHPEGEPTIRALRDGD